MWNLIFDACALMDRAKKCQSNRCSGASEFLYALRAMLPCVHCRDSYRIFIGSLGGVPVGPRQSRSLEHSALRWAHNLKNLVNAKLGKPTDSLAFDCFVRRMNTWTSAAGTSDLVDVLCICGLNLHANSKDVSMHQKRKAYVMMVRGLGRAFGECAEKGRCARFLLENPPKFVEDTITRSAIRRYLCRMCREMRGEKLAPSQLEKRYASCAARAASAVARKGRHIDK